MSDRSRAGMVEGRREKRSAVFLYLSFKAVHYPSSPAAI